MPPRRDDETVQVNLRIKESLRRQLEEAAKERETSLNAEMAQRIEHSFEVEKLRRMIDYRDKMLDSLVAKQAIQGQVVCGWIENELRDRGFDVGKIKDLIEIMRAYFGTVSGATLNVIPPVGGYKPPEDKR